MMVAAEKFLEDAAGSGTGAEGELYPSHLSMDQFVWLRTNKRKPIYTLTPKTGEKQYGDVYTAWFDTVDQYHGRDPGPGLTFSTWVDGRSTEGFRKDLPYSTNDPAHSPEIWIRHRGG